MTFMMIYSENHNDTSVNYWRALFVIGTSTLIIVVVHLWKLGARETVLVPASSLVVAISALATAVFQSNLRNLTVLR